MIFFLFKKCFFSSKKIFLKFSDLQKLHIWRSIISRQCVNLKNTLKNLICPPAISHHQIVVGLAMGLIYLSKYIRLLLISRLPLKAPLVMLKLLRPIFLFHLVQSFRFFFKNFFNLFFYVG